MWPFASIRTTPATRASWACREGAARGQEHSVIADDYVDTEFGTGVLKVTPAHDVNDYVIGEKYNLEVIDIFNPDGTVNGKVGLYEGMDRFALRERIEKDLDAAGLLEKTEAYTNNVGFFRNVRMFR